MAYTGRPTAQGVSRAACALGAARVEPAGPALEVLRADRPVPAAAARLWCSTSLAGRGGQRARVHRLGEGRRPRRRGGGDGGRGGDGAGASSVRRTASAITTVTAVQAPGPVAFVRTSTDAQEYATSLTRGSPAPFCEPREAASGDPGETVPVGLDMPASHGELQRPRPDGAGWPPDRRRTRDP